MAYQVCSVDSELTLRLPKLLSSLLTDSILGQANASACVSHTPCAHQSPLCRHEGSKWGTHGRPLLLCVSSCALVLLFLKSVMMGIRASPVSEAAHRSSWIYYFSLLGWRKSRKERFSWGGESCAVSTSLRIYQGVFISACVFPSQYLNFLFTSKPFFFLTASKSHRYDFPTSFMEAGSWAEQTSIINVSTKGKTNMEVWPLLRIRKTIEN